MCLERIEAAPDVDDLRMVRSREPIDDPKALGARIGFAGIAIRKQGRVGRLLERIGCVCVNRQHVEMGDVEDRSARRRPLTTVVTRIGHRGQQHRRQYERWYSPQGRPHGSVSSTSFFRLGWPRTAANLFIIIYRYARKASTLSCKRGRLPFEARS